MSIYGPKAGQARPVVQKPLHWLGVLIGVVVGVGLGIYFVLEEEREAQQAEQRERAETIRRQIDRSFESADVIRPAKRDAPERLQSADIIH